MADEIRIESVAEHFVAAVRLRVSQSEIAGTYASALEKVRAFLRGHRELQSNGPGIFIYCQKDTDHADGKMLIDFGVLVDRRFTAAGEVACVTTPAGRAAVTLHRGAYDRLIETHARMQRWCAANGHSPAGVDWEVYGDWNDDPTKLETRVFYLLR